MCMGGGGYKGPIGPSAAQVAREKEEKERAIRREAINTAEAKRSALESDEAAVGSRSTTDSLMIDSEDGEASVSGLSIDKKRKYK
jgi:hypothetical protein